jgi:hypothetical protein
MMKTMVGALTNTDQMMPRVADQLVFHPECAVLQVSTESHSQWFGQSRWVFVEGLVPNRSEQHASEQASVSVSIQCVG